MGKDYMGEFDVPLEEVFTHGTTTSEVCLKLCSCGACVVS